MAIVVNERDARCPSEAARAPLPHYAKVDVTDDAGTIILAEEQGGDSVLQFLSYNISGR